MTVIKLFFWQFEMPTSDACNQISEDVTHGNSHFGRNSI